MLNEIFTALELAAQDPRHEKGLLPLSEVLVELPASENLAFWERLLLFADDVSDNWVRPVAVLTGNLPGDKISSWLHSKSLPAV